MARRSALRRLGVVLAMVWVLAASQGCTYLRYRGEDFLDIADIGFTVSIKPGFALYADAVSVLPLGFSYVDGYFLGWGGGQFGFTRHYEHCWGLLAIGHETHAWGKFSKGNPSTLNRQFVGIAGLPLFPVVQSRPSYMPACVHYLHLGFIGAAANARYMEIIDFLLGFACVDLARDDGKPMSRWPWRGRY
jgi:hypothetical protein